MGYQFPPDIQERIREQMASGHYGSEDDLLRDALRALDEENEDLAAVQNAIFEWHAGDQGVLLGDAFESLRKKRRP
jgi:putative addiction module CopG family antidote